MLPLLAAGQTTGSTMLYGNLDIALDRVSKGAGNVAGTVFAASPAPKISSRRMSTSISSQSHFGIRGTEDLGGGYAGRFALESALVPDNGTFASDGRFFGRQAWVGLTTPVGELRLGRQAAPMLQAYYLNTLERLGSTNIFASGAALNNLQAYQDNAVTYVARTGAWIGMVTVSPNAGVAGRVSAARSSATPSTPPATATTGQVLGGLTAGDENTDGRGSSHGAMLVYNTDAFALIGAYHYNKFHAAIGLARPNGSFVPLYNAESYRSAMVGAKGTLPQTGTQLAFNLHEGRWQESGNADPQARTLALAVKQPWGPFSVSAEWMRSVFTNYTRGSDTGTMLGSEYQLSKRTALFVRAGYVQDHRGTPQAASVTPVLLAGGPLALMLPLGSMEIPIFSGQGTNLDARTSLAAMGIRHSF
jgi:predicted porin